MKAESHLNPPRPQPRAPEPRDETIDRITQLLTTIVQHQTHVPEITIEHARRVGATSFDGSGDPDSAHAWLNDLERNLKMNEFYKLVQGSMTVDAYEKKVTELSRAAPHIVENEVNRCRKFEEGLKHEIKTYISAAEHTEYGKLVESALRMERNINEAHRFDQQR
ncbi:hypothetical protein JRO89_XS11G0135700 [Xanthoceras sorbifolium]|uniref:Retrotransposon gag domain-containing protein n=1 Tax=Xanthoceras sorbifolium TaxID=99658 RepID=A0ABQ8HFH3_9ROSI|nr:hypothetical protein JRO89_XS11G0135700 [Xanthoceras sorbifolium]